MPQNTRTPGKGLAWASIAVAVVAVSLQVSAATHSVLWGALAGFGLLAMAAWLLQTVRHQGDARVTNLKPEAPSMLAMLEIVSLPEKWRAAAWETMGPLGGQSGPGMTVDLRAAEDWLTIERHRRTASRKPAFTARVPLHAVRTVTAGPTFYGVRGSSLRFELASGERLVFGLGASPESAERAAAIFRAAAEQATWDGSRPGEGIEITSKAPALRTPPLRAVGMWLLFLVPIIPAFLGARDGTLSAAAAFSGFMLALVLRLFRPLWMGKVLAAAMALCGLGFAADALRLAQPWRMVAAVCCALLALYIEALRRRPSKSWRLPETG